MFQQRSFLNTLTSLFLVTALSHAALLPASLNLSIQSENMRHILKWSSLQEACSSVNYTVKYQGEFEYMQNHSWQDEYSCSEIVRTECDLSLALSSDSDYNISVLAQCDNSTLWTQLPKTFNRRDTVVQAPDMSVNQTKGRIEVYFGELQNHINVILQIWKEGDEQNVFRKDIRDPKFVQDVRVGGKYCLKAEAILDITNKTNSTATHCVHVQELEQCSPLVVGIAVALTLIMAVILGLITLRCSLCLRKSINIKEPLPNALLGWPEDPLVFSSKVLLEPTHTVLLLDPSKEQDRTSETRAMCDEEPR